MADFAWFFVALAGRIALRRIGAFTGDAIRCSICSRSQPSSFRKVSGAFKGSAIRCSVCNRSRPPVFTTARGGPRRKCNRLSGCGCTSGEGRSKHGRATSTAYAAADCTPLKRPSNLPKRGMLTSTAYTAADCTSRGGWGAPGEPFGGHFC